MQVLGGLETRSLQFERVFILDANEGVFPEAGPESTLLPFPVRQALGLSTYRDQEDIAAYHFELLAAGAKEMHLFYVNSADKERSRFVERLLWERQRESGLMEERGLISAVSYRVDLTNAPPAAIPKTAEVAAWLPTVEYSATSLDAYLQCPLKFYYRTVLRLSPREDISGEIESAEIGTFVHAVLSRYFEGKTGRPLTAEDADPDGHDPGGGRPVRPAFRLRGSGCEQAPPRPGEPAPARLSFGLSPPARGETPGADQIPGA